VRADATARTLGFAYRGHMAAFSPDVVGAVLHHMNDDHIEDNVLIARAFTGLDVRDATMTDLDEDGGTWRYAFDGAEHELRIAWPAGTVSERPHLRREIVALYDEACRRLGLEPRAHE
jgi:hypothetical protein